MTQYLKLEYRSNQILFRWLAKIFRIFEYFHFEWSICLLHLFSSCTINGIKQTPQITSKQVIFII